MKDQKLPGQDPHAFFQTSELYKLLVSAVQDYAIFALDPNGIIMTWNEGAEKLKGYQANEVIGSHFSRFYSSEDIIRKHPEDELAIATRLGKYEEEGWRIKKDGSRFWANVVITAIKGPHGEMIGFTKITRDLTERKNAEQARIDEARKDAIYEQIKQSEETLDQIFSASPSFMTLISVPELRYLKSNEEHFKLMKRRDIIGKTVLEVEPELEEQGFIKLLKQVALTGETWVGNEVPITYYRGENVTQPWTSYIDFVFQPLKHPDGTIYAISAQGNDVTEKVLSKKTIESEREKLHSLLMQAPVPMCTLEGSEHRFTLSNPQYDKLVGREVSGKPIREVFSEAEAGIFIKILDEVYRTGEPFMGKEVLAPLVDADGKPRHRYLDFGYHPFLSASGEVQGIVAVVIDVTDYVLARKTIEQNSAFLNAISEATPDFIFSKDLQNRMTFANPAIIETLGKPKSEIMGHTDAEFLGEEIGRPIVENDQRIMTSGIAETVEETLLVKGRPRTYISNKVPYRGTDNQVIGLLGISRDVTDLRKARKELESSELRYRTLTEALPQLVWGCLPDGQADYLSQQWIDYTGISEMKQLGLGWLSLVIHPDDEERVLNHWLGAVNGLHPYDIEYRIRRFDGAFRWFKTRGTKMYDDLGSVIYWFGTSTDIHDTREIRQQLEDAVRARDDFLSIASHELKTPLTSLKLQVELRSRILAKGDFSIFSEARLKKMLHDDSRQIERINHLIDDMLDISRINSGKLSIRHELFDLSLLTEEIIARYKPHFDAANTPVSIIESVPLVGTWDRFRIDQVITNLLTNAIRYGEKNPVEVKLERRGEFAVITIRDHGIGIAKENQKRIFERFERAVSANEISGLGLGLYIVKQIVDMHGGTVQVRSEINAGSQFIVELPFSPHSLQ